MKHTKLRKQAKKHTNSWWRKKRVEEAKTKAKERDNYTCQRCGRSSEQGYQIHGSHIYPEGSYHSLSANVLNIMAKCAQCHMWWHENPAESGKWIREKFPERMKELDKLSREITKIDWEHYVV